MKKLLIILLLLVFFVFGQENIVEAQNDSYNFEYNLIPVELLSVMQKQEKIINKNIYNESLLTLPYPIIFIHGLDGGFSSWDGFYNDLDNWGFSFGGFLDFCLNSYDISSMQDYCNLNYDINDLTSGLSNGNYYIIDFDCDPLICDGSGSTVRSDKAAITLGGRGVGVAIDHVLNVTGKDKVILICHSMGGLNAREYLQNDYHWQGNNHHRVAKLITSGTPHGGSNFTLYGLLLEWSEAIRDLRRSYYAGTGIPGAYLYGNTFEDHIYINNGSGPGFITNYYNVDINCNGQEQEWVVGLNQKSLPDDLGFACISSDYFGNGSDGVVGPYYADLSNYYPQQTTLLELFDASSYVHSSQFSQSGNISTLTEADYINFKAMDEPEYFSLAYKVDLGINYKGFFTYQDVNHPFLSWGKDLDSYYFYVNQTSNISIVVNNLSSNGKVELYDYTLNNINNLLAYSQSNASGYASIQLQLNPGKHYIDISGDAYGNPANGSPPPWDNPYNFIVTGSSISSNFEVQNVIEKKLIKITNILGEEIPAQFNIPLLYIYDDGTVEKKIIID